MTNENRILANYEAHKKCDIKKSLALKYHVNSKLSVELTEESIIKASPLVMNKVFSNTIRKSGKKYLNVDVIELQKPDMECSLYEALVHRKSHPDPDKIREIIEIKDLSTLTWSAYGMSDQKTMRRTIPSAGALYPCELYILSVDSCLPHGLYHYNSFQHNLERIKKEEIRLDKLFTSTIGLQQASIVYVITSMYKRSYFKYGERAYRFMLIEAGEIVQNLSLAAAGLGYNATAHGGTADYDLEKFMGINGLDETVLIAVGIS